MNSLMTSSWLVSRRSCSVTSRSSTASWRKRRGGAGLILSGPQAADLTRVLATIDKFLRSDYAGEALSAFLACQGAPAYHAGILTDEVSFTQLKFRQLLTENGTPSHHQARGLIKEPHDQLPALGVACV
jgi:hypothetical protein